VLDRPFWTCVESSARTRSSPPFVTIKENKMLQRLQLAVIILTALQTIGLSQEVGSTDTAPTFMVDAEIVDSSTDQLFVAVRPYFEHVSQSYHVDSTRHTVPNVKREISVLQSEVVRLSLKRLQFYTIDGKALTVADVQKLKVNELAFLLLPEGASLHPAIKATLKPETIIVSKVREKGPPSTVIRPTTR
jgi:hypothetical protein